jgi:hypothetical protein
MHDAWRGRLQPQAGLASETWHPWPHGKHIPVGNWYEQGNNASTEFQGAPSADCGRPQ